jgi:beta-glucosidase
VISACLCATPLVCGAEVSPKQALTQKIDALVAKMTMEEKVGQMVLFTDFGVVTGPGGTREELESEIRRGHCGNVFNAHTVKRIRGLQRIAVEETRLKIPLLFGYDVIHGYRTVFPIPLAMASSWDLESIERAARIAADEATAAGLNWTFAPMVDIARDPRWGRIAEGAGEDPFLGCEIAKAQVRGFQGEPLGGANHLLACAKHFAAYGAVLAGRDYNTVDISERTLREVFLPPYKAATDAGALSVMSAFNDLNGIPATANKFLLTHILRDEWGFAGFVVTDYTAINELVNHGVATNVYQAAQLALDAGADMDMQGGAFSVSLEKLADAGAVSEKQIDTAVGRILLAKFALGLFDDPYRFCDEEREATAIYTPANLQAAHDIACESMVLLKNTNGALPLKQGTKIAVIGPLTTAQEDLLGSWHGRGDASHIDTLFDSISNHNAGGQTFYAAGCGILSDDRSHFDDAFKAAEQAEVVVMVLGESASMTGEAASRTSISLPGLQSELLERVNKIGRPTVLVLVNGRPLALGRESSMADAILEAWQPGSEGAKAVADVLFGRANPCGRLPVTFPRNVGQVPIFYGVKNTGRPFNPLEPTAGYRSTYLDSPNTPLYPFGFGLSYTRFGYSPIKLDHNTIDPGGSIAISLTVSNAGTATGADVAQLYIRHLVSDVTRPVLELKGFQRVQLARGESRDITFHVGDPELTFLRQDMTWGTELGAFEIFVGPNSIDLQSARCDLLK